MSDSTSATALSEIDRLRLHLSREKASRLSAEMVNLQMAMEQTKARFAGVQAENIAFFDKLKADYALAPADEISEDGAIKRSPVRAIKTEG